MNKFQKGFTLIEIVIGITVVGIMSAITVPSGMNAYKKAEANNMKQEFYLLQSSVAQLRTMKKSHIPVVEIRLEKMSPLKVPVSHSTAFSEVRESQAIKPVYDTSRVSLDEAIMDGHLIQLVELGYDTKPDTVSLECSRKFNKTVRPSIKYDGVNDGEVVTSTLPLDTYINDTDGVEVIIPNLGSNGTSRIPPIFNVNDATLLEDFIDSPKGLNLKDFRVNFKDDMRDVDLLCILFGGKNRQSGSIKTMDFTSLPEFNYPIKMTKADINNINTLEANSSLKLVNNTSDGQLFYVTKLFSKQQFIEYLKTPITDTSSSDLDDDKKFKDKNDNYVTTGRYCDLLFDSSMSASELTRLLGEMYDIIAKGFQVNTPVYVPHRFSKAVKCVESDLKHGYYRP